MEVVAVDWYCEFKKIPDRGFIALVNEVLRKSRFFPVIADIWNASEKIGLCDSCKYRNSCDAEKKFKKDQGVKCDSFIKGRPDDRFKGAK